MREVKQGCLAGAVCLILLCLLAGMIVPKLIRNESIRQLSGTDPIPSGFLLAIRDAAKPNTAPNVRIVFPELLQHLKAGHWTGKAWDISFKLPSSGDFVAPSLELEAYEDGPIRAPSTYTVTVHNMSDSRQRVRIELSSTRSAVGGWAEVEYEVDRDGVHPISIYQRDRRQDLRVLQTIAGVFLLSAMVGFAVFLRSRRHAFKW